MVPMIVQMGRCTCSAWKIMRMWREYGMCSIIVLVTDCGFLLRVSLELTSSVCFEPWCVYHVLEADTCAHGLWVSTLLLIPHCSGSGTVEGWKNVLVFGIRFWGARGFLSWFPCSPIIVRVVDEEWAHMALLCEEDLPECVIYLGFCDDDDLIWAQDQFVAWFDAKLFGI